ncbi:MAG: sulfite exporter TauE/SafE family protein [Bacteroidales bacterium]|nr:sulfite exporter TauE/SafE family protein [Bacteroidales bacterium]
MEIQNFILLCLTGILAGVIAGGMGVGGGILIVPVLVFLFGMTQHEAQGTSLAVLLPPVSILALISYHKKGFVNYKFAAILIVTFIIGSYLGGLFAVNLPEKELKRIFGMLLLLAGIKMIFEK